MDKKSCKFGKRERETEMKSISVLQMNDKIHIEKYHY